MRKWLIELRNISKKSQCEVAKEVGISQSYYAAIETGERGKHLPVPLAKKIGQVLGFDWTIFYEETECVATNNEQKTG